MLLKTAAAKAPFPETSHWWPMPPQETIQHQQFGLVQSPLGSLLLPLVLGARKIFLCHSRVESLFLPVLLKSCNQILLACKVRFPGDSQSLTWISKLGKLTWGSEPSQQGENLFGISILQFCGHPLREYWIWFYNYCTPPTIWLWLLLWIWGICFGSSSVFLLMIVQQLVTIFLFSQ